MLNAADEHGGLAETAHLLRCLAKAEQSLAAIERAWEGGGTPARIAQLRNDPERAGTA